ncbi:unannotated protein [freshwater metagenome]|uniref:Unannotated protein n=1 Tax=freshwater metagenome TaxID=449393 RepID=A0A6J7HAG3_9ZZZZ|nr:hypothetical protein [Actinomycetota bacterium]
MRTAVLTCGLVFVVGFLVLTIHAAIDRGFTVLSVISLGVVAVIAIALVGVIREGLRDDD